MCKPEVEIYNWEININHNGDYSLSGTAVTYPLYGNNVPIYETTAPVRTELKKDILIFETLNTVYVC